MGLFLDGKPVADTSTSSHREKQAPFVSCPIERPAAALRGRFSASPATGLIGLQENGFLGDFFGCLGFLSLASERYVVSIQILLVARSPCLPAACERPLMMHRHACGLAHAHRRCRTYVSFILLLLVLLLLLLLLSSRSSLLFLLLLLITLMRTKIKKSMVFVLGRSVRTSLP